MNNAKVITKVLLIVSALFFMQFANAYQMESIERIRQIAENFTKGQVQLEPGETLTVVTSTDLNYSVAKCDIDITPSLPANMIKDHISSVELRCMGRNQWTILVPVTVNVFTKALVAKNNIPGGEIISENNIDYAQINKSKIYDSYFTEVKEIAGLEATHLILAGTVLTKKNIRAPLLIKANHAITLIGRKGVISVSMQGIAKEDGSLNSLIKVFNPSSKRIVEAVVTGLNEATVGS